MLIFMKNTLIMGKDCFSSISRRHLMSTAAPHKSEGQKNFKAGDTIMTQGETGDCAYIIESGSVEILVKRGDGKTMRVDTRGPGSIIGEMALVDDDPRTATLKAISDCTLLEISKNDYAQRLKNTDPIIQMITQVILTRYRDLLTRVRIFDKAEGTIAENTELSHSAHDDALETVKIGNELKAALENGELQMHYQPIIGLDNGEIRGFESLMRWIHPEKGFISPGLFIPIAEQNGFIVEITKWALKESCEALARMQKQYKGNNKLYMSINFTGQDFAQDGFVEDTLAVLKDTGLDIDQIQLEITERLLIEQPDNARDKLQRCHDLGMRIAIDDFGTGYSSLSYLYYFPITALKVDQSFIRQMVENERSQALVKSIIALGKSLELKVVAEGIEHLEEAKILKSMGCDTVQGYHFAKPQAENDITAFLQDHQPFEI
jgi:EAL domain-containing protein (putative c-di-GMP-specific phosphodiesterase class I)/CRP-like cAMP-binding protein